MRLKSDQIIQVNATVIVGLLILFTLQTFVSPVDLIPKFTMEQIDLFIEKKVVDQQIIGCAFQSEEFCEKLYEKSLEIDSRIAAIDQVGQQLHPFTDITTGAAAYLYAKERVPIQIFYTNLLMVLPFASSAVIELISSFRNRINDEASRASLLLLISGFVVIMIGLYWIIYLTDCQSSAQIAARCFEEQVKQGQQLLIDLNVTMPS